MAYVPNSGSVVAFQGNPSVLQTLTGLMSTNASVITVGGAVANQSVSGTVQADIRGSVATVIIGGSIAASFTPPANQSVSGTVTTNQGTNPWIITGSVQGTFSAGNSSVQVLNFPTNQSVSGEISVSNFPTTQNVSGSVAAWLQSTNASVITVGTAAPNQSVSGTVQADIRGSVAAVIIGGSILTTTGNSSVQVLNFPTNQSVSGAVSVSNFPTTQNVSGSVVATQGTNPWTVVSSIAGGIFPISGSVAATITNTSLNVNGSVVAFQGGTRITSVSGQVTVVSSLAGGIFPISGSVAAQITNTTVPIAGSVAAFLVGNASVITVTQGSVAAIRAGQIGTVITSISGIVQASVQGAVTFQTASIVSGHGSVNGVASVQVLAAPGASLYNYITDFIISNTGAATTLVTFTDGDASILGKTIAPAGGGSNATSLSTPMKALKINGVVNIAAATATSVLHAWVGGDRAP